MHTYTYIGGTYTRGSKQAHTAQTNTHKHTHSQARPSVTTHCMSISFTLHLCRHRDKFNRQRNQGTKLCLTLWA